MSVRTRSRVDLRLGATWQEDSINTSCSHTTRTYGTPNPGLHMGKRDSMTDTIVPNFHTRRKIGEVFFNNMASEKASYSESYTNGEIRSVGNSCASPVMKATYYMVGSWAGQVIDKVTVDATYNVPVVRWNSTQAQVDSWVGEACTEMFAKRGYPPQSNLWESLAEARKTVDMLNRPLLQLTQRLTKIVRARSKLEKLRLTASTTADYWLLYRYGLRPLLMDITSIISGLDKVVGKVRQTTRSSTITKSSVVSATNTAATGVVQWSIGIQTTESLRIRAMSLDEYTATVGSNIGFTAKALLTTPYELIPYSFVADWFFNVGDYLNAIVPALGWKSLGSCYTAEANRTTIWTPQGTSSNHSGYTIHTAPTGVISGNIWSKVRLPVVAPKLVVVNDFKFDKTTRQADAAALLGQLFLRAFAPTGQNKRPARRINASNSSQAWGEMPR